LEKKKAEPEGTAFLAIACHIKTYLAVESAGVVAVESAGVVAVESAGVVGVVGSTVVVVESVVSVLSPELLQATAKPATAKINKTFFICCDFFCFV